MTGIVIVMALVEGLICGAVLGMMAAGRWRLFEKAGLPGWPSVVPIYAWWVTVKVINKPIGWFFLLLVPVVGVVLVCIELAKAFGKTPGYGVGMALLAPVFFPLLGFSDARYEPPPPPAPAPRKRREEEDVEEEEEEERPRKRRR
jgi:hypothetical protein